MKRAPLLLSSHHDERFWLVVILGVPLSLKEQRRWWSLPLMGKNTTVAHWTLIFFVTFISRQKKITLCLGLSWKKWVQWRNAPVFFNHQSVKDGWEMGTLWRNDGVFWTYWHYIDVFFPAAGFISVMLKAPLNYVLIPAASLPRVLWGILRGSVDAVSDTFRFLPFIFPPTQSPCTVAGECCWNLRFSQMQRRKEEELCRQITAASFITNYKDTN